jgi:hypothetical protein
MMLMSVTRGCRDRSPPKLWRKWLVTKSLEIRVEIVFEDEDDDEHEDETK